MGIVARPLRRRDVALFVTLLFEGFPDQLPERGTDPRQVIRLLRMALSAWGLPLWLAQRLSGHEAVVLLAWDGPEPVGCLAAIGPRACPSLTGVYVRPSHRDQKVGLLLVEEIVGRLHARGCPRARVAAPTAGGEALARSAGFVPHDRVSLYRLPLPTPLPPTPGVRVRRIRQEEISPWERLERVPSSRLLARLLGFRTASILTEDDDGPLLRASLCALAGEKAGEVRVEVLRHPADRALLAVLAAATAWTSRLGKQEVSLFLPDHEEGLVRLAEGMGLSKVRSWARLSIDLTKRTGRGDPAPRPESERGT